MRPSSQSLGCWAIRAPLVDLSSHNPVRCRRSDARRSRPGAAVPLGAAQAYLLRDRVANAWVWAAAMPLLWALGWTVSTFIGVDVDRQFAVFGASGAVTFMALSGVLLDRLRADTPVVPAPQPDPSTAIVR